MLERLRGGGYPGTLIYEAQGLESVEAANSTLEFASMFVRSHAQGVIAPPTSHLMQLFQKYFGDFPRFHIQNMVDTNRFSYVHAPDLNPSEAPILMWVGRLETNKNWRYFLEIGAALAAHVPNLQLWMIEDANISEPGERVHFQATVASLGLGWRLKVFSILFQYAARPYAALFFRYRIFRRHARLHFESGRVRICRGGSDELPLSRARHRFRRRTPFYRP
jgi:Glycosyltransferase